MEFLLDDLQKVLLAILLGGLIGLERESRDKAAGIRTNIFICLGATLFTVLSTHMAGKADAARIAANVVTGIGFLGAGVIFRDEGRVKGLTTAALIWFVAAVGMSIGLGNYVLAVVVTLIVMAVLLVFPAVENYFARQHEFITYTLTVPSRHASKDELLQLSKGLGLKSISFKEERLPDMARLTWALAGRLENHEKLQTSLLANASVKELTF